MNNIFPNRNSHNIYSHTTIATEFCEYYYELIRNNVNSVFEIFHSNVTCTVEQQELVGSYNLLVWFTNQGIHHFDYDSINKVSQPISSNEILINVHGVFRAVSFWGETTQWFRFNEMFILENIGNEYLVKNYSMQTIQ